MSIRYEDYESEDALGSERGSLAADREISLGTTTVLGIFLGLALVCALFFAFGYSMGRRSVPSPLANVNTGVSSPLPESHLTPGSLPGTNPATAAYVPPAEHDTDAISGARAPAGQHTKPPAAAPSASTPASVESAEREQVARAVEQATTAAPRSVAAALEPAATAPVVGGSFVQVTAISPTHRADADMLVSSLRRKGYAAAIHTGSADQLLHVQLGPFSTRKEAEAMRQRLSVDGYNSILK